MMKQVLGGIKVLEITQAIAGPFAARVLADFGATVIRVETVKKPDLIRIMRTYKDDKPGINRSLTFSTFNCNKRDIALNFKRPRSLELAMKLVAWADVLIENFSPGTMADLGLAYEDVTKVNPAIIMASVSNMGQSGPYATQPAYGPEVGAMCGFTRLTGWPDRLPINPWGGPYADIISGRLTAALVMAALDFRRRTGKGQFLDLSMVEAGIGFLAPEMLDYRVNGRDLARAGNKCTHSAPHGAYPCRGDDNWVAIAVSSDRQWTSLCGAMGSPDWTRRDEFSTMLGRKENETELDELVSNWTRPRDADEVMVLLQEAGVPAGVVRNLPGICGDPQLRHRQHYWTVSNPEIGDHHCDSLSFRLSESPAEPWRGGPLLGQDNEYVCREILGMSEESYDELVLTEVFE